MVVIYAEKASLAKSIAQALNAGKRLSDSKEPTIGWWEFSFNNEPAILCHGAGHLCENAKAISYGEQYKYWNTTDYPCIPKTLNIEVKENTKACYQKVSSFFSKADWLINATDPDREGELIFGYIYDSTGCKLPWKRAILEDTTSDTIKKAFANLKDSKDMLPLQMAGRARAYADWIIGINCTVAMTSKFGGKGNILSIGRVQTPVLSMIVEREKAIKNHTSTPFWKLLGNFSNSNCTLNAEYTGGNFDVKENAEKLLSKCNKKKQGVITKIETKVKKQYPPKLFNATQLRIACNKAFGWSLKETDEVMQSLYEHHFMTYPRSSSEYLPESMKEDITITLNELFKKHYEKYSVSENERVAYSKRHFDNSKVGSHTAIVPTKTIPTETEWNNLSEKEQKLYDLLAKSIIRIVYSEAVIEETNIDITVDTEIVFSTKATHIQSNGWFVVDSMPQKTDTKPICCEGDILNGTFELKEGKTEPPKRYTQASLVAEMELAGKKIKDEETRALMLKNNCGLGTEATRTAIVQALFKKGYISEKGKSIYPTEKGIYIIDILPIADLKSAEMTGEFEKKLNDIANSCYEYSEYVSVVQDKTQKWFKEIVDKTADSYTAKDELKCPFCKKRMNIFDWGVSCSGYKEGSCDFTLSNKICQKKITQSQMQMLLNSGRTRLIKGFTSKKRELFDAVLVLDNESRKLKFEFPKNKKGK